MLSLQIVHSFAGFEPQILTKSTLPSIAKIMKKVLLPVETVQVLSRLAPQEHPYASILSNALNIFEYYVRGFEAAIDLFEMCWDEQKRTGATGVHHGASLSRHSQWKIIAARDGAMTIYHIGELIAVIMKAVHNLPSLSADIDNAALRSASKAFRKDFPHFTQLRHAVAHSAELFRDPEVSKKNSFNGTFVNKDFELDRPDRGLIDVVSHRSYGGTIGGQFVTYELDLATLEKLRAAQRMVENAIGSLAIPLRRMSEARPA